MANTASSTSRRAVEGNRLMQAANDMFLGSTHTPETGHDDYWRQFRVWGSVSIEGLNAADLKVCALLCGWPLARAHARSRNPADHELSSQPEQSGSTSAPVMRSQRRG